MNYKIVRQFFRHPPRTIKKGLTEEEARAHCKDPEGCSSTCTSAKGKAYTERVGPWRDTYTDR